MRIAARFAILAGTVGSIALMLITGHRQDQQSQLLLAIFALWVASPFVMLDVGTRLSKTWGSPMRKALHWLALFLTAATLAIYAEVAFGPPRAQSAGPFVIVPPASWVLTAIVLAAASRVR